jgi:hypothetical protein
VKELGIGSRMNFPSVPEDDMSRKYANESTDPLVGRLAGVYCEPSSRSPSSVAKSFLAEQFCKFSSSTLCITLY